MKRPGISDQIIIIAVLPALLVATIMSVFYISDQIDYIDDSLNNQGRLIAKQLAPAAEYAVYSGNMEIIKPLTSTVIKNNNVIRIQILDDKLSSILDINNRIDNPNIDSPLYELLFESKDVLKFSEPILSPQILIEDSNPLPDTEPVDTEIGKVIVTLTTSYANYNKQRQIIHGVFITLITITITLFIVYQISRAITQPIKSLSDTVKNISSGNFDIQLNQSDSGEIGILQSSIRHMADDLKQARSDMEDQLDEYTDELQQTMEELEIRNAELDIARSKAIDANNAKSDFLANMSHEIRTPLSGIIGFSELLHGTELNKQQQDYADTIQKSANSLLEIINDILDLSKIESGKMIIASSEFNLIDIIEDIINLLSPSALKKDIEIFYRVDKDVPTFINSDPFRIHQILTNLIGNAIKFTEHGYVYLQVSTGEIRNIDSSIKFTVSDTGIGMNSEDKKKLFRAFTQADTSITRRFGGTGLGLVISRKLTMLMNGDIGFDSDEGEGSTFWFSVPVIASSVIEKPSELADKNIAFFSDHFIAKQTFTGLFENIDCHVKNYTIENLARLATIERENDITIVFLGRKDLKDDLVLRQINRLNVTKPSMLIASTRSHSKLRELQGKVFDNAVFTSEKIERIKQKLINSINKDTKDIEHYPSSTDGTSTLDWSNINVMVVDDNEVSLRLAEILLHKHKARVTTARSGEQAIDYATMNPFDIIFMDLHMPGLDGYETTKRIRDTTASMQAVIIALTANALPQEKEKVIASGMNGILIKPVNNNILQKVISQWVLKETTPIELIDSDTGNAQKIETTTTSINSEDIFSIEIAKEFTGNNEALAYELFAMLRKELDSYMEEISNAVENNDLKKLRDQVHKLHGASRCCGTSELKNASSHIEKLIDQNMDFDLVKETSALFLAIKHVAEYEIAASTDMSSRYK